MEIYTINILHHVLFYPVCSLTIATRTGKAFDIEIPGEQQCPLSNALPLPPINHPSYLHRICFHMGNDLLLLTHPMQPQNPHRMIPNVISPILDQM